MSLAYAPIASLLTVWSMLETARLGINSYGGDTAEIYAYLLTERSPSIDRGSTSEEGSYFSEIRRERSLRASRALYELLRMFEHQYRPELTIHVDGRALGPWLMEDPCEHRWHVKIEEKQE